MFGKPLSVLATYICTYGQTSEYTFVIFILLASGFLFGLAFVFEAHHTMRTCLGLGHTTHTVFAFCYSN